MPTPTASARSRCGLEGEAPLNAGQAIFVTPREAHLHKFDKDGRRIELTARRSATRRSSCFEGELGQSMSVKLSLAALARIAAGRQRVRTTSAPISAPGMVHIGVGNFHRAHQAVYLDDLFGAGRDHDWAIVGAGVREPDIAMREKLAEQDWLTTVVEQEAGATTVRVTGAMIDFIKPFDVDADARHARAARDPHRLADRHRGRLLHLAGDPALRSGPSRHRP